MRVYIGIWVHVCTYYMTYTMNEQITLVNGVEDLSNSVACLGCMLRGGSWSRDPRDPQQCLESVEYISDVVCPQGFTLNPKP